MRVSGLVVSALGDRFKSPNMIANFRPAEQAGLGHVIQIAKRGRLVGAARGKLFRDIRVRQRSRRLAKHDQRRDSSGRGAQTRFANRLLDEFNCFGRLIHNNDLVKMNLTKIPNFILATCN